MSDCIFCMVIDGRLPSTKVYEDEYVYALRDIKPQMETHIILVPKKHIDSIMYVGEEDAQLLGHIQLVIKKIAASLGIDKTGFRVISNCGEDAGQTVLHLHYHILAGRKMGEKIV